MVLHASLALAATLAIATSIPTLQNAPVTFKGFADGDAPTRFPAGWATWSPRPEISPVFTVERGAGRTGKGALAIRGGGSAAAVGSWRTEVGVEPGRAYRFTAHYRATGKVDARRAILARLDWLDAKGERMRPPDYALESGTDGGWTRIEHVAYAPDNATRVRLELEMGWSPEGTVYWDDISLVDEPSPRDRRVKVITVAHRPRGTSGPAASVEEFCKVAELAAAAAKPDVVCLPEGITLVGTNHAYPEVAESIPGPTTRRLGELAKKLNSYVVAGIYERVGPVIYNTAVLVDRKGALVGKYRKTHLPREEVEGGLTPGDAYPTFVTDFGRVGLMICWDVQFPEPARALALQGAEVLLLPIWGGSETLARARAIENHVFLVSASYDMKTFVVDPSGAVLAEASTGSPTAIAEMALDHKIVQPWLGDMKGRTWKERRGDIPLPARK